MAYLAIDAAHGLYAAFYACHGSPRLINFGFPIVHRTSRLQENNHLLQVPGKLILPWSLSYTIMAVNTDLGESNQLATTIPGCHLKAFKASPIVLEQRSLSTEE
eukprot:6188198-Pleurochrysis_carterae.AAC.6